MFQCNSVKIRGKQVLKGFLRVSAVNLDVSGHNGPILSCQEPKDSACNILFLKYFRENYTIDFVIFVVSKF